MNRPSRNWRTRALAAIVTVIALLTVNASPAAAYPGPDQTSVGMAIYLSNTPYNPKVLYKNQYISNTVVDRSTGRVLATVWLVVQSDGNLVLYKHSPGGSQSVCWAVNVYQNNAPNPHLKFEATGPSRGRAQLWWGGTLKWETPQYDGTSIDISGWTGQLYVGIQPITSSCY